MNHWQTTRNDNTQHRCFVLFSTTSSLLSRTIRWATDAPISHVAIAYECATTGRALVLEASGDGFRGLTWERWREKNQLVHAFRIEVPTKQWQEALGSFCDTLGTPYDTRRLALEVARHFSRGLTLRFPWADTRTNTRGVLCSDAVADFLRRVGFSQFRCPPSWTPVALLTHMKSEASFTPVASSGVGELPLVPTRTVPSFVGAQAHLQMVA